MPTFFAGQTDYIEKLNDVDAAAGAAQDDIDAHIADTTAAHAASAIANTPAGGISATTVQAALNELDTEKFDKAGGTITGSVVVNHATASNNNAELVNTAATGYGLFSRGGGGANYAALFLDYSAGNVLGTLSGVGDWTVAGTASFAATNCRIASNGNVTNLNGVYGTISDAKLKRDWTPTSPKLQKILAMQIVDYYLRADQTNTKLLGMIAQDLRRISPGLVEETPDYEDVIVEPAQTETVTRQGYTAYVQVPPRVERRPLGTVTLSIKYSVLVPMLVKGLQELHADFDGRLKALEAELPADKG